MSERPKFYKGQKVVMVRDWSNLSCQVAAEFGVELPKKGPIYTVRDPEYIVIDGVVRILLAEIVNQKIEGYEPSFPQSGFAPLDETGYTEEAINGADISELNEVLQPQTEEAGC